MFGLSKKKSKENLLVRRHFLHENSLYRVEFIGEITEGDLLLPIDELVDKFGGTVSEYDGWRNCFVYLDDCTVSDLQVFFDDESKVDVADLDEAIKKINDDCKKKFDDFKLAGSLYSEVYGEIDWNNQCFYKIAKPKKKLIDEKCESYYARFILEIEVLDGKSATTRREFIYFCDFIERYELGHSIKVVDSDIPYPGCEFKTEDYFEFYGFTDDRDSIDLYPF
jgi:hypothetical protein